MLLYLSFIQGTTEHPDLNVTTGVTPNTRANVTTDPRNLNQDAHNSRRYTSRKHQQWNIDRI